ncbi:protein transport protein Sec16A isoform X2 [Rhineura floridana]|uniref:protein transport protein Sec16A isoform X2 n=1 Tax=Rhineura floridana TaxID=261503 RepID=UPI002AC8040C|nr:protein transport protein Sec16A isoform X2 [Rhineura floridana]
MQPPPQAVPTGAGGPPPLATSRNMYWRNGPFGRRANVPVSTATGPVQPVTDPFAFGKQVPQGAPFSGSTPKEDPPVMQVFSPMTFPPPAASHPPPPHPHIADGAHGLHPSLPAPVSHPGANSTFSSMAAPLPSFPPHVTNSAEMHLNAEHGRHNNPLGQSHSMGNSLGGHPGLASVPDQPPSGQEASRNPSDPTSVSASLPVFPPAQQTLPQWKLSQSSLQPQGQAYSPYPEPSPPNAFYAVTSSTAGISDLGPHQSSPQQPAVHNTAQAPLMYGDASSVAATQSIGRHHHSAWQNPGGASPWPGYLPQEHFYLQPLESAYTLGSPATQENSSPAQPQSVSEAASGQGPAEADSGTISMFFKGDEAENEEILSSERADQASHADTDAFPQTMGHTYYQPLHSQQIAAAPFSPLQGSAGLVATAEPLPKGVDVQHSFRTTCEQSDTQASKNAVFLPEDKGGLCGSRGCVGPQYENVENLECVQNQEVLPSESLNQGHLSPGAIPDPNKYALLLGPSLPKNSAASRLEAGPNLEAPGSLPRPVRSDSVSSNYSNLSHHSVSSLARLQELGTFIQQESGKPEEDSAVSFFKQIDSSPLGGNASGQSPSKSYHSQAPTPSPPKPMGVFQTSANSSFEPVRSYGLGVKPTEADQAKMVAELRESRPSQRSAKKSPATPVASPGNLEQPPDNLETLSTSQAHPLPLMVAGSSVSTLQPTDGSLVENMQLVPDKKPSARAQGNVKKCESPATTLWAHNELPDFAGNVLLAPAAPAVYVPAKQTVRVVQPPQEGLPGHQPNKPGSAPLPVSPAGNISSENLENPPKMGDEEALRSQTSSGYASLLSSPPTEALQNQPVLIAQPNQSYSLAQPVNFSLAHQLSKNETNHLATDPGVGNMSLLGMHGSGHPSGPTVHTSVAAVAALSNSNFLQGPLSSSEMTSNKPANLLTPPVSQGPLTLAPGSQKASSLEGPPPDLASKPRANASGSRGAAGVASIPPALSMVPTNSNHSRPKNSSSSQEPLRALDFTVAKTLEQSGGTVCTPGPSPSLFSRPGFPQPPSRAEPGAHDQELFYQQVTKDTQPLSGRATPSQQQGQAAAAPPQQPSYPHAPSGSGSARLLPSHRTGAAEGYVVQPPAACAPVSMESQPVSSGQPSGAPAATSQPFAPTAASSSASQPAGPQHEHQCPPPSQTPQSAFGPAPNPYYYYRHPYDGYPSYQPPYAPVDPRTAHLYYQEDPYGRYDLSYRQYDSAAAYRNSGSYQPAEPERPSSRASHTSDRPPSRQGYPDDYYSTKSGWSDYYADYYANPYDYGDPSRYPYDARYRDPRGYDQRYWYDQEQTPYQKREAYPYGNSHDRYEDHWRYDPRCAGSFEDELETRRDLYGGDEFDRRSVHSEHSGHSLRSSHSRQSSFSSRSQQSQLYRSNHDLTANAYEAGHQPTSLHAEYSCGGYSHFDIQPPFTDSYSGQPAWPAAEQVPSRPLTPEKFSVPHVCARFGPGGHLIKVLSNLPSEGQPALVEIHSMEMVMQHSSEQEEMRAFPGPLTKDETHKVDVINFAQKKAMRCSQNEVLIDKESARLLWDFVVLLCRQNGTVVGTDIAELLLRDHKTVWLPGKSPNEANLIDFTNEALEQAEEESGEAQLSFLTDSLIATIDSLEKETERFRELLLYGRKKDALESAMKHGLWGHALLLASKMDSRTHARVMTRFANSLPINDPLQTVYQLMSGRMPAASTCCGDEKWGDWRPHLAMVLSNLTNNVDVESRTITTMGDTLASKGLLDAAHFCYLMAQVGFGVYTKKSAKLVLIGSNHSLPFSKFATNEAVRRTEAYEYAQSLGTQPCCLPNFQVFKFIYACRLAEVGLAAQAFHYYEVISKAILRNPCYYSPVLISQLIQISSQLRLFDPQIKEKPEQELFIEPDWLVHLRSLDGQIKEGCITYSAGRCTPQPYHCSTPSSELDHVSQSEGLGAGQEVSSGSDNPLLAGVGHPLQPSVQLMPSAPQVILDSSATTALPSHQEAAGAVPFYPVAPSSVGPGPGYFHPYGAEQIPAYPGPAMGPPAGPSSQANKLQPQEQQVNQEAGVHGSPQESQVWKAGPDPREEDFYGKMASMGSGRRSRSTSQSSVHMGFGGRRSRTTSESSVHSVGRERRNSAAKQPSPPPPSILEGKETKKDPAPRKSGATWFGWLMGKGKNEAHLPDDKNKSIVWDEKKQRWVNLDEPEEESKPPPPPPVGFPQVPPAVPSGTGGPPSNSVNMFSRRAAGSRARYVDILNPSGAKSPGAAAPAPSDLFAPLAPMPIPANLFVPNSAPEDQQPLVDKGAKGRAAPGSQPSPETAAEPPYLNSAVFPPGSEQPPSNPEDSQLGELSRSSSMSSLSSEVSQHFNQLPLGGPPAGTVQFYNPSQFAQPAASPGSSRLSRIGQRKYPTLK